MYIFPEKINRSEKTI